VVCVSICCVPVYVCVFVYACMECLCMCLYVNVCVWVYVHVCFIAGISMRSAPRSLIDDLEVTPTE